MRTTAFTLALLMAGPVTAQELIVPNSAVGGFEAQDNVGRTKAYILPDTAIGGWDVVGPTGDLRGFVTPAPATGGYVFQPQPDVRPRSKH
jgi:hypothetical protein